MPGYPRPIVPPQVLDLVARAGSPQDRESALNTLAIDSSIRTARVQNAVLAPAPSRRLIPAAGGRGQPNRTIYDAQHRTDVHATVVLRAEGAPEVADESANEAYDGLGATYSFYWEVLTRDSIDDAGLPLLG